MRALGTVALLAWLVTSPVAAGDLTVEVRGTRTDKGTVQAALFDDAADFLVKPMAATKSASSIGTVVLKFPGLTPGIYALSVFHDENGNDVLDKNLLGIPTEKFGFSRDAAGLMGPPKFDAARFTVGADSMTIVINLH